MQKVFGKDNLLKGKKPMYKIGDLVISRYTVGIPVIRKVIEISEKFKDCIILDVIDTEDNTTEIYRQYEDFKYANLYLMERLRNLEIKERNVISDLKSTLIEQTKIDGLLEQVIKIKGDKCGLN